MPDARAFPGDDAPDVFWRSLGYFSIYRIITALVFLGAVTAYGQAIDLGRENLPMFVRVDVAYMIIGAAFLAPLWRRRPGFGAQLTMQVAADIVFLTLLMHASGGQRSGIAFLILVALAAAGLVGQGRMVLFYAALGSVTMLLEQGWRVLSEDGDAADFFRTGLTCVAFFGTAITARLLARRVVASEQLAQRRGAELEEQRRIGARIIRDMAVGVLVVDPGGDVRNANPAAVQLLGVDLANHSLGDATVPLLDMFRRWAVRREEAIAAYRAPSGRFLRIRYLPGEDPGATALLYLEDMDQVRAQAQQLKLAALGRLTANIAHEIRNPLAAISHAAELLAEEGGDPVRERLARIVGDNTVRLNRLVTEVLELGRRDRAEPEVLQWPQIAVAVVDELALTEPSAARRVQIRGDGVAFSFDRGHFHRVLWNLLGNALRHASDADGAVVLRSLPPDAEGRIAIDVQDDGPGISETLRGQVFEPFFTTRSDGTGLGLYIARELCEGNGATLELLDERGKAHFRILAKGAR